MAWRCDAATTSRPGRAQRPGARIADPRLQRDNGLCGGAVTAPVVELPPTHDRRPQGGRDDEPRPQIVLPRAGCRASGRGGGGWRLRCLPPPRRWRCSPPAPQEAIPVSPMPHVPEPAATPVRPRGTCGACASTVSPTSPTQSTVVSSFGPTRASTPARTRSRQRRRPARRWRRKARPTAADRIDRTDAISRLQRASRR